MERLILRAFETKRFAWVEGVLNLYMTWLYSLTPDAGIYGPTKWSYPPWPAVPDTSVYPSRFEALHDEEPVQPDLQLKMIMNVTHEVTFDVITDILDKAEEQFSQAANQIIDGWNMTDMADQVLPTPSPEVYLALFRQLHPAVDTALTQHPESMATVIEYIKTSTPKIESLC